MGRKPNQAIRHFFERGPKLNDNSNRYQQTCKRCGEKFEKGRQEALVAHIAKACQGVSSLERDRFLAEIQQGRSTTKAKKSTDAPTEPSSALPGLSGLEALAEVSRHHGQQSLHNDIIPQGTGLLGRDASTTSSLAAAQTTAAPPFMGMGTLRGLGVRDTALRNTAMDALDPPYSMSLDDSLVDYTHGEAPTIGLNYSRHAIESMISAPMDNPEPTDDLVDYSHGQAPVLDDDYTRHHQALPVRNPTTTAPDISAASTLGQAQLDDDRQEMPLLSSFVSNIAASTGVDMLNAITSAPAVSGTESAPFTFSTGLDSGETQFQIWNPGLPIEAQPKKVRGAFAPDRRTAVKEVRKKGACLRCRMLKKSCDSADPCQECAKLENARMWKGQCVRTRLAQIFNVFSSTLFMNIAHNTIEQLRSTTGFTNLPGRLEVSYFANAGLYVTFPCSRMVAPSKYSSLTGAISANGNRSSIIINTENEGVGVGSTFDAKIAQYGARLLAMHMNDATAHVMFGHISKCMYHTLRIGLTMNDCVLVARAIDLFMCVTFLVKGDNELLAIHEPRLPPTNAPVDLGHSALQHGEGVHYIYIQLRRKLERACDLHFKAIMAELEKSLIQRKQADNFETFVGTVILLRCLEMVAYMYKGYDHLVDPSVTSRKDTLYGAESWPLDNPPSHYWGQGERFSDLLVSMLRLRRVLPVMRVRDGIIKTDSPEKNAREWFDAMSLRADVLQFARDKPYDSIDGNSWELRWMGKLFETQ